MPSNFHIRLIDEKKANLEEVVSSLLDQKSGTKWAGKTNQWAIALEFLLEEGFEYPQVPVFLCDQR